MSSETITLDAHALTLLVATLRIVGHYGGATVVAVEFQFDDNGGTVRLTYDQLVTAAEGARRPVEVAP